ncbi:MAG: hypothetical protein IJ704_04285 [Bacilli bacterium]|nr:hypothetical protein [Bacilli bacterium]
MDMTFGTLTDQYIESQKNKVRKRTMETYLKRRRYFTSFENVKLKDMDGNLYHKFQRIASISGSLWYPHLELFIQENALSKNIDQVYFSLVKKEKNSKNNYLSTIEEKTKAIENIISQKVRCKYEENHRNYFQDVVLRIAKGITWILKEGEQK